MVVRGQGRGQGHGPLFYNNYKIFKLQPDSRAVEAEGGVDLTLL